MADRTVYGHTHSENGWRMVDQGSCVWVQVPGTNVTLQIREGQPAKILAAFAADFNAYVEPLRDADSACWTATNSVSTSNHLSGTAMDLNWNGPDGRTFRLGIPEERAYPPPKNKVVRELLAFYEGMVFCGGDWSIRDFMHLQMNGGTYGSQNVAKVNDFIRRKIRSDGFSTFRRASTPQGEDELSAEAERMIREMHRELTQRHPSRSPFRHVGEGPIDTWAGIDLNDDAHGHVTRVIEQARLGHPESIALLKEVAAADPNQYPDRRDDALLAQAVLASLDEPAQQAVRYPAPAPPGDVVRDLVTLRAENARLREENTRLQQEAADTRTAIEVYTPDPIMAAPSSVTVGQLIGQIWDLLAELQQRSADLPPDARAPLGDLIKLLEPGGKK